MRREPPGLPGWAWCLLRKQGNPPCPLAPQGALVRPLSAVAWLSIALLAASAAVALVALPGPAAKAPEGAATSREPLARMTLEVGPAPEGPKTPPMTSAWPDDGLLGPWEGAMLDALVEATTRIATAIRAA